MKIKGFATTKSNSTPILFFLFPRTMSRDKKMDTKADHWCDRKCNKSTEKLYRKKIQWVDANGLELNFDKARDKDLLQEHNA